MRTRGRTTDWWLALAAGCGVALASPAHGWQTEFSTAAGSLDVAALAVEPDGDPIAGGTLASAEDPALIGFGVVRLAGADGREVWRRVLTPAAPGDSAHALAIDATGDVIAAGWIRAGSAQDAFTVVKLAAGSGIERWRVAIPGAGSATGAFTVALDAVGDVVAGGTLTGASGESFAVVKLSGASGRELWRYSTAAAPPAPGPGAQRVTALAIDGEGDVLTAGVLTFLTSGVRASAPTFIKLRGTTGEEEWRHSQGISLIGKVGLGVAATAMGDAIVLGRVEGAEFVERLAGSSGSAMWSRVLPLRSVFNPSGPPWSVPDDWRTLALDAAGDVLVTDGAVTKLAGADGAPRWSTYPSMRVATGRDGAHETLGVSCGSLTTCTPCTVTCAALVGCYWGSCAVEVKRLDSSGLEQWNVAPTSFGGRPGSLDAVAVLAAPAALATDADGNAIVAIRRAGGFGVGKYSVQHGGDFPCGNGRIDAGEDCEAEGPSACCPACHALDAVCQDGNPCTLDSCGPDGACRREAVPPGFADSGSEVCVVTPEGCQSLGTICDGAGGGVPPQAGGVLENPVCAGQPIPRGAAVRLLRAERLLARSAARARRPNRARALRIRATARLLRARAILAQPAVGERIAAPCRAVLASLIAEHLAELTSPSAVAVTR